MATLKFIQAQRFSLSGAGASIGDTTLTLQSMAGIDGTLLTTTDVGTIGFGTIEPGNGTQEEAISYTGITQNANGTATLTGVKTVLFVSPYTGTSGLAKTHAGASTFILSNDAAFYGAILDYVDNSLMASGIPMTTTALGIAKISVAPVSAPSPIVVGDNDPRLPTVAEVAGLASTTPASGTNLYITQKDFQKGLEIYGAGTGTASAYAITALPVPSAYASGMTFRFQAPSTNATGVTLNVDGLGAKTIKKNVSNVLASGDILASQVAEVIYDGVAFQLVNPPNTVLSKITTGNTTHDLSSTTTQNIAHGLGVIPRLVRLTSPFSIANAQTSFGTGTYDGVTNQGSSILIDTSGTNNTVSASTSNALTIFSIVAGNQVSAAAAVTFDATNIILTWSKSGSPTGTAAIQWEAYA